MQIAMLFYFALTSAITATVVASKSAYVSRLMKDARPTANSVFGRFLEGGIEIEQIETENALSVDLSEYSLRFEQCRYVESDAFAVTQRSIPSRYNRFAIFRFCPSDSCDSCESNFGEYVIDLKEYLQETVAYQRKLQEEMCETCDYVCEGNDDLIEENADDSNAWFRDEDFFPNASVECNDCYNECEKIKYMTENGYIDATEFIGCQMVYDPEDDGLSEYYAGPVCASNGSKINIGLFLDDKCTILNSDDKDVEDHLMDENGSGMKLSHALLKKTYSGDCVSCIQEPKVLGMCTRLYDFAETFGEVTDDEEEVVIDNGTDFFNSGCVKPNERYKFAVAFSAIGMIALLFT